MDYLKEYVKEWINFYKSENDMSDFTEQEIFDIVMEDVVSIVQDYKYTDYQAPE